MTTRTTNASNYPSVSWANTLDIQKSALRWDVKRAMKSLCGKLEEIGEECFVVTVNPTNGWVGHFGTMRGDEYIDAKSNILYDFLSYCTESLRVDECNDEDYQTSDSESCGNSKTPNCPEDDDEPITISRPPPPVDKGDKSDTEKPVIVQTPTQYLQTKTKKITKSPVNLEPEKIILLNTMGIPILAQKSVVKRVVQEKPEIIKEIPKINIEVKTNKKRKQSCDGKALVRMEKRQSSNTSTQNKKGDNESIKNTDNVAEVSDSDRVLRSSRQRGKRSNLNTLLRKRMSDAENEDTGSVEEDWSEDDDQNTDDLNDEDWAETTEDKDPWLNEPKRRKSISKRKLGDFHKILNKDEMLEVKLETEVELETGMELETEVGFETAIIDRDIDEVNDLEQDPDVESNSERIDRSETVKLESIKQEPGCETGGLDSELEGTKSDKEGTNSDKSKEAGPHENLPTERKGKSAKKSKPQSQGKKRIK